MKIRNVSNSLKKKSQKFLRKVLILIYNRGGNRLKVLTELIKVCQSINQPINWFFNLVLQDFNFYLIY